jgi:hypothetical protein
MSPSALVLADVPVAPDIAIDSVQISDPHAAPGSRVELKVRLRNAGLGPLSGSSLGRAQRLLFSWDEDEPQPPPAPVPLPIPYPNTADSTREATVEIIAPTTTRRLRVELASPNPEDNPANNDAEILIGIAAPEDLLCRELTEIEGGGAALSWRNAEAYDELLLYRNGRLLRRLAGDSTSAIDAAVEQGEFTYNLKPIIDGSAGGSTASCTVKLSGLLGGQPFRRGDVNVNGGIDIADAVLLLSHRFLGEPRVIACDAAADVNGNGTIELVDALGILTYLFIGGFEPAAPFRECGFDPRPGALRCESYSPCRR